MRVSVIGTGYVGLVSGTCFSEMGNDVVCVDIDEAKVNKLTNGELTIFEPGLEVYFERNLREDRLHFTTELAPAVEHADLIFLALPTPPGEDGSADLRYVLGVAKNIGELLAANPDWGYKVIVDKSTVPVGTADLVTEAIAKAGVEEGARFDVVSNPEFLREGVAVDDFMKPERVVVGTSSEKAADLMTQLYEPFVRSGNPIIIMDEKSAEMTKYAANALLATKITFMNEIANVCDRVGADVDKVRRGIGTDSRIGPKFLYAGIGFGGSCFPKDVQALVRTAQQNDYPFEILQAVLNVNETQRTILMPRIEEVLGDLRGKKIAMWGLAFKPNTDDVREASSHAMIRALTAAGADVVAYDPEAIETTRAILGEGDLNNGSIHYTTDSYGALIGADVLVICTEWPEFRRPDFGRLKTMLKAPIVFDGRNLYDHERMSSNGFEYYSIGRPFVEPVQEVVVATNGRA
ncbi:MAG: UDP-glucose/GDP-mannose dehydrogenase family protein [Bacteroidota bacterium]